MPDIIFNCPQCQSKLAIDERGAGMVIDCPKCSLEVTIPQRSTRGSKTAVSAAPTLESQNERSQILNDLSRVRKQLEEEQHTALENRRQFEAKLERKAQQAEAERRRLKQLLDEKVKQAQLMEANADQFGVAKAEITRLRNKCDQLEQFATQEKAALREELEASIRREKQLQRNVQETCTRIEEEYQRKLEISEREKRVLQGREEKVLLERNHLLKALDEQRRELEGDTDHLNQRVLDLETRLSEEQQRQEELSQRDQEMELERKARVELENRYASEQQRLQDDLSRVRHHVANHDLWRGECSTCFGWHPQLPRRSTG